MSYPITQLTVNHKNEDQSAFCSITLEFNARTINQEMVAKKHIKNDLHVNNWAQNNWDITFKLMQQKREYFEQDFECKSTNRLKQAQKTR